MTPRPAARTRRISSSAKRPQLMIFAEGEHTEPVYFTYWFRTYRERVIVKMAPHRHTTTPMELVEKAINQRSADVKEAKRGQGDAYDEYWCVFDVDSHPRLPEALQLAASAGIRIALSNPCIELWLILHFVNQTAYLTRTDAERESEKFLGCGKTPSPAALKLLVNKYETARGHARGLDRMHERNGSTANSNPSSGVWRLVDVIRGTSTATRHSGYT
jgi:RloB-like protein